jgi:2-amino-4-hydroxy-6-hydroxymethyldihydropteridine diphosphokinase
MNVWQPAYVGLGSNLQEPRAQVAKAFDRLGSIAGTRAIVLSPLYGSKPFGPVAQPDFVNAVAGLLTQLPAEELLAQLRALEQALGRPASHEKWGPRVIDLDLLAYGRARHESPLLVLPHPGIAERNFVLHPLAAIAPDLDVPGLGRVASLKERVAATGLWPLQ